MDDFLIDSNILLRLTNRSDPDYLVAKKAITTPITMPEIRESPHSFVDAPITMPSPSPINVQ